MRSFIIILVSLVLFGVNPARPAAPDSLDRAQIAERVTGTVTVVAAGGANAPGRRAVQIGERTFDLVGDRASVDALFENEGHEVEVRGVITNPLYVGGDGRPLLTILSVTRLCKCSPLDSATSARLAKLASLRALEDLSEVQAQCAADALARYGTRHPADDPGVFDGIHTAVRSVSPEAAGVICVRCERFGGIAAIWQGSAVDYRYDAAGHYLGERSVVAPAAP